MTIWTNPTILDKLEERRNRKRKNGTRLTFDCFNLKARQDERAICSKGRKLSKAIDGSIAITTVLNGRNAAVCSVCPYYEDEVE